MVQTTIPAFAPPPDHIEREFRIFHRDNPAVYSKLVALARQAKARGRTKIGIAMPYEVIRWEMYLSTTDPDWKLNNNFRSRYARLIMEQEPDLKGFFDTRTLRAGL